MRDVAGERRRLDVRWTVAAALTALSVRCAPSQAAAPTAPDTATGYHVSGTVTDDDAQPVRGAKAVVEFAWGGLGNRPTACLFGPATACRVVTETDEAGRYQTEVESWLTRAEVGVEANGFLLDSRPVLLASPLVVHNVVLRPHRQVAVNDTVVLPFKSTSPDCTGPDDVVVFRCEQVLIVTSDGGVLDIAVTPFDALLPDRVDVPTALLAMPSPRSGVSSFEIEWGAHWIFVAHPITAASQAVEMTVTRR